MGTLVPVLKGAILMTNKEKLIEYIHNLSNEDAEKIISYLTQAQKPEEVAPPLLPCSFLREQEVVV